MRNLPDEEVFKELEGRLQGYEELPDEMAWENIVRQIPNRDETWIRWADRSTFTITIIILALTHFVRPGNSGSGMQTAVTNPTADSIFIEAPVHLAGEVQTPGMHRSAASPRVAELSQPDSDVPDRGSDKSTVPNEIMTNEAREAEPEAGGELRMAKLPGPPSNTPSAVEINEQNWSAERVDVELPEVALPFESAPDFETAPDKELFFPESFETKDDDAGYLWAAEPAEQKLVYASPAKPKVAVHRNRKHSSAANGIIVKPNPQLLRRVVPLYLIVTPGLAYYTVSPSTNDAVYVSATQDNGPFDKTRRALEIETGIQLYLYKGLRFQGGLSYYHQNNQITIAQWGLNGSHGGPSGPSSVWVSPNSETTDIEYRMNNIGITAGLLYAITLRQFSHQAGATFQCQYGVGKKESFNYNNAGVRYYNYGVFYRLEFGLSESVRIFGQPSYTGALNSTEAVDGLVTLKYRRIGLGFGIIKDF